MALERAFYLAGQPEASLQLKSRSVTGGCAWPRRAHTPMTGDFKEW